MTSLHHVAPRTSDIYVLIVNNRDLGTLLRCPGSFFSSVQPKYWRSDRTEYRQGEQHNGSKIFLNPFEEVKPRINEYTAQEIATLSSRLEKQLGPEYISSRPGAAGQKVHYLSADKCINLANAVFGFNGWSSGIQNIQIDFVSLVNLCLRFNTLNFARLMRFQLQGKSASVSP